MAKVSFYPTFDQLFDVLDTIRDNGGNIEYGWFSGKTAIDPDEISEFIRPLSYIDDAYISFEGGKVGIDVSITNGNLSVLRTVLSERTFTDTYISISANVPDSALEAVAEAAL